MVEKKKQKDKSFSPEKAILRQDWLSMAISVLIHNSMARLL